MPLTTIWIIMRKVLITGGFGQLGRAIAYIARGSKNAYIALSSSEADICDEEGMEREITAHNADIIINCAAYTDVERAERDREAAERINHHGVATLARVCSRHGVKLIHISTDYVFGNDEERTAPYTTDDKTTPINSYGRSKAQGEVAALDVDGGVVIRTSWLYAPWGKNFCRTILHLATEQDEINVVDDQRGTPTSALSLARAIVELIDNNTIDNLAGIYHYTDAGEATWYDFACEIIRLGAMKCKVKPCTSAQRATAAARPRYSVLDKSRIIAAGVTIRPWQETLKECITLIETGK